MRTPPLVDPGTPGAGLIVVLHGGGSNPAQARRIMKFTGPETVVYAAGTGRGRRLHWNAGPSVDGVPCFGGSTADDLKYLDTLIGSTSTRYGTEPRVLVVGDSEGAALAALYVGYPDSYATHVALVSGGLVGDQGREYGGIPAAVRIWRGFNDTVWPADGSRVWASRRWLRSRYTRVRTARETRDALGATEQLHDGGHGWEPWITRSIQAWWRA